ncbi:31884_t:CDS:2 [Racocetra persica]|uniref:31884_t:CDS:1 n=1 Tax=Racocetra persica TaxID=160502 RepID=A0ACA9MUU7_9GLOM|nr:31884_t:CDS:2 [Racocetra persica]
MLQYLANKRAEPTSVLCFRRAFIIISLGILVGFFAVLIYNLFNAKPTLSSIYTSSDMIPVPGKMTFNFNDPLISVSKEDGVDINRPLVGKFLPKGQLVLNVTKFQWVEIAINITEPVDKGEWLMAMYAFDSGIVGAIAGYYSLLMTIYVILFGDKFIKPFGLVHNGCCGLFKGITRKTKKNIESKIATGSPDTQDADFILRYVIGAPIYESIKADQRYNRLNNNIAEGQEENHPNVQIVGEVNHIVEGQDENHTNVQIVKEDNHLSVQTVGQEENHPNVQIVKEDNHLSVQTVGQEENHPNVQIVKEDNHLNVQTVGQEENHPNVQIVKDNHLNVQTVGQEENHPNVQIVKEDNHPNVQIVKEDNHLSVQTVEENNHIADGQEENHPNIQIVKEDNSLSVQTIEENNHIVEDQKENHLSDQIGKDNHIIHIAEYQEKNDFSDQIIKEDNHVVHIPEDQEKNDFSDQIVKENDHI